MGPAIALAPFVGLAASGFSAISDVMKGNAQASGDAFEAGQLNTEAAYGTTKAMNTSTQMQQQLATTLGNISAIRASGNVDPTSPTSGALLMRAQAQGDQNRNAAFQATMGQVAMDKAGADYYEHAATQATIGGFLGAAGQMLTGLAGTGPGGLSSLAGMFGGGVGAPMQLAGAMP